MPIAFLLNLEVAGPTAPVFTGTIPTLGATKDVAISTFATGGYFSGAVSYALTGTLPAGLSFNTSTGAITGTPTVAALTTGFIVTATNTEGSTPSNTFSILVSNVLVSTGSKRRRKPRYYTFLRGLR